MAYTIRNVRPSVLHIVDADLRLESGQTAVVPALTPQMQSLLTLRALEVVTHDGPSAPMIAPPAPEVPPPASDVATSPSAEQQPAETPADTSMAMPAVEEKRGGRKATTHAVTTGGRDDAR